VTVAVVAALRQMGEWVDAIPPLHQPMRYGNKAFRSWNERLVSNASSLCAGIIAAAGGAAAAGAAGAELELAPYLCDSFGNATRIDYGTGHETNFFVFLCALPVARAHPPPLTLRDGAAFARRLPGKGEAAWAGRLAGAGSARLPCVHGRRAQAAEDVLAW